MFREGKAAISSELSGILERLGSNSVRWWSRIEKLSKGRLLGRFFAASRDRLPEVARGLGVHHLANLGGCPARRYATSIAAFLFRAARRYEQAVDCVNDAEPRSRCAMLAGGVGSVASGAMLVLFV